MEKKKNERRGERRVERLAGRVRERGLRETPQSPHSPHPPAPTLTQCPQSSHTPPVPTLTYLQRTGDHPSLGCLVSGLCSTRPWLSCTPFQGWIGKPPVSNPFLLLPPAFSCFLPLYSRSHRFGNRIWLWKRGEGGAVAMPNLSARQGQCGEGGQGHRLLLSGLVRSSGVSIEKC